jgi:hypothetical protein
LVAAIGIAKRDREEQWRLDEADNRGRRADGQAELAHRGQSEAGPAADLAHTARRSSRSVASISTPPHRATMSDCLDSRAGISTNGFPVDMSGRQSQRLERAIDRVAAPTRWMPVQADEWMPRTRHPRYRQNASVFRSTLSVLAAASGARSPIRSRFHDASGRP